MLLTIDVGNTNITIGAFKGECLLKTWRIATRSDRTIDEYRLMFRAFLEEVDSSNGLVHGCVISSVVPNVTPLITETVRHLWAVDALVVGPGVKSGIKVRGDNPREVGADRIVNAVATYQFYPTPAIVVDCGTAISFDVITDKGEYIGGAIAPGVGMVSDALVVRTAKLKRVELNRPVRAIGRNTEECMQSGIVFGYIGLIEYILDKIANELNEEPYVVFTGGQGGVLINEFKDRYTHDPELTLKGLQIIAKLNGW
ncbi:MAG: type III pantothenate kinase [Limnochordia bacterium]